MILYRYIVLVTSWYIWSNILLWTYSVVGKYFQTHYSSSWFHCHK